MRSLLLIIALTVLSAISVKEAAGFTLPPLSGVGVGTGVSLDVENISPKNIRGLLVFSVKFICGEIDPTTPNSPEQGTPLAPGSYRTAVNIHNPDDDEVNFIKKAVIALPQNPNFNRGPISPSVDERLAGGEALEVDCRNIAELFTNAEIDFPDFAKGFVVVKSKRQLDVVGVYTLKNVEEVLFGVPTGS